MPENPDKIADKLGFNAPNSQVNIENMFVGSSSDASTKQQDAPIDWQKICRDMLIEREQLTSNRLMVSPDMHKTLDVFVDLALVQQNKADKRDEDVLPEHGSKLYEPSRYSESERFELDRFLNDVLGAQKNERLTIIGEPGSGKTTLLQKIAFWLLDNTEDLVLWVSLGELRDKPLRDYLSEDWLQDAVMYADARMLEDWERQFLQRRVWLLLDGLDEMTPETRDALSLKGWVAQSRVITTCRLNVWQTNPRIINGFATYRMLEFRLPQIEEFTQKWFSQDKAAGKHLYQALNQPGKERIRDLVKNPLRLTLLCSTWHLRERQLPDTRAELYEQFVDDLYEWKRERLPTSTQQRAELNNKLGELSKEAIDKELTRFRLRRSLVCRVLGEPGDPNSMLTLALNLGWLNAVGVDPQNPREPVYAFFHATFQEYFATKNIEDWNFFMPSEHEDKPVGDPDNPGKARPYRIFQPQWKEVILLWLGREDIELEAKYEFIEVLLNFDDGCGQFYGHRAFFLAVLGILELPNHPRSEEAIDRIIRYSFGEFDSENRRWLTYFEPLEKQARIALLSTESYLAVNGLTRLLESNEVYALQPICYEITDLLAQIDFGSIKAFNVLIDLLETAKEDWLKLKISKTLIRSYVNNPKGEKTLVELSKSCQYEWIRRDAAWSLIKAKPGNIDGINSLIKLLCTSQDLLIIRSLNLEEIGLSNPKLLRQLLINSYAGKTQDIRTMSMAYLTRIFVADEKTIEKVLALVRFPKKIINLVGFDKRDSESGIQYLKYVTKLADESRSSDNKDVRKKAFWKIIEFAIRQPEIAILMAKLSMVGGGGEARKRNISLLFKELGIEITSLISVWMDLVSTIKDSQLRTFLAVKMTDAGFEDDRIVTVIVDLLDKADSQDEYVRYWLANGLIKYDPTNSKAIATFLELLQDSENWYACQWVTQALGEACNNDDAVLDILIELFSRTSEQRIIDSITSGLQEIFRLDVLKLLVSNLKSHFTQKVCDDNFSQYQSSFEILWHCASRLPYPEFYKEWHNQSGDAASESRPDETLEESNHSSLED